MVYKIVPISLNALLAWMISVMKNLPFVLILATTYMAGMVLFLLPPVPGPPIYLFAGFVIAEQSPFGFWWGCFVCIALCFFMKMSACTVQQKVFGQLLGSLHSVRQTVGVHKPFIRAVELILRRPGLSPGKVAILCGGPDWPVSVLAGILRIPLWECLLGTCPILISLVPMTLTGSFYLRRDESAFWERAGNIMFLLTGLVSLVFWAGMGWAIQDAFERHGETLTAAKQDFVDLEWLYHRSAVLAANCVVAWSDMPTPVRVVYAAGALGLTSGGLMFFWRPADCFGTFSLTDDVSSLQWSGEQAVVRWPGFMGLAVAIVSYFGLATYLCWLRFHFQGMRDETINALDMVESGWKQERLQRAWNTEESRHRSPRSFGSCSLPGDIFSTTNAGDSSASGSYSPRGSTPRIVPECRSSHGSSNWKQASSPQERPAIGWCAAYFAVMCCGRLSCRQTS